MSDYDSPWKEALDCYFQAFLAFFFSDVHADIDWALGYESLDTELRQVIREAETGPRVADKLVKVWLRNGEERWVLIHVEVQSQYDSDFPHRMYVYNYRLFDRYNREVVSLAVLGDERPEWRPTQFSYGRWGCTAGITFRVAKLLDWAAREAELEANANPFATVVLAHLKTQETRTDTASRQQWKMRLVRGLYERGMAREDVARLFGFIDWLMDLPQELEDAFWQDLQRYEEERRVPYITSVERMGFRRGREEGRQEGRQEGLREGLLQGLKSSLPVKFGPAGQQFWEELQAIADVDKLIAINAALPNAAALDDLRRLLA